MGKFISTRGLSLAVFIAIGLSMTACNLQDLQKAVATTSGGEDTSFALQSGTTVNPVPTPGLPGPGSIGSGRFVCDTLQGTTLFRTWDQNMPYAYQESIDRCMAWTNGDAVSCEGRAYCKDTNDSFLYYGDAALAAPGSVGSGRYVCDTLQGTTLFRTLGNDMGLADQTSINRCMIYTNNDSASCVGRAYCKDTVTNIQYYGNDALNGGISQAPAPTATPSPTIAPSPTPTRTPVAALPGSIGTGRYVCDTLQGTTLFRTWDDDMAYAKSTSIDRCMGYTGGDSASCVGRAYCKDTVTNIQYY